MTGKSSHIKRGDGMVVSYAIILIWILFYIGDCLFGWMPILSGNGFSVIGQEYYRLLTGFLLHGNALHLAVNAVTMFWIGRYLEKNMGRKRFLLFGILTLPISQILFYALFPNIDNVFGGSILTFAYIGIIVALRFTRPDFPRLKLGTWCGNWIIIYAIVGNLPLFSFMNLSTVALHGVSFAVGSTMAIVLRGRRYPT